MQVLAKYGPILAIKYVATILRSSKTHISHELAGRLFRADAEMSGDSNGRLYDF